MSVWNSSPSAVVRSLAVLSLAACTAPIVPTLRGETCETTIPATWPVDGAVGVYHRGAIEFTLSEPDETATVLADFDGVQSTRADGLVVVYTPTEPLDTNTTYTVSLDYCRGTPSISFTTSELGEPLAESAQVLGGVYAADFTAVRFLSGDGVGQVIRTFIGDELLLQVVQASDHVFQLRAALVDLESSTLAQDPCATTALLPESDFSDQPWFEHAAADVVLDAYDVVMHLTDFQASGTVAPDASWIGGIALSVTLDTREAAEMLGLAAEDICELASNVGLACEPCNDGQPYCGTLVLEDLGGEWVEVVVEEVTEIPSHCPE